MKATVDSFNIIVSTIGGILGEFLGNMDGILYALVIFVILDYVTGVLYAVEEKKLSSAVGYEGIARKVTIFILVGIANILDSYILGQSGVLRAVVIFFYLSNEGISILENATELGLPVPEKLKNILNQLTKKEGE
ncbi:phage holin family protein [uncultured Granulicatella sp.]|uniref:phage holin family protein n=1 Tax=uncultured Granulicatella sp. TaxID=316089 RepID=UPI0028D0E5C1|nr:phage holin family protein [uncultured Granulicatella sp.]